MKVFLIALLTLGLVTTSSLMALGDSDLTSWLKGIADIFKSFEKKDLKPVTASAGVRGAPETAQDELYWKGLEKKKASPEELILFQKAVDRIEKQDYRLAREILQKFLQTYPESPLAPEAREGVKILSSM